MGKKEVGANPGFYLIRGLFSSDEMYLNRLNKLRDLSRSNPLLRHLISFHGKTRKKLDAILEMVGLIESGVEDRFRFLEFKKEENTKKYNILPLDLDGGIVSKIMDKNPKYGYEVINETPYLDNKYHGFQEAFDKIQEAFDKKSKK